MFRKINLILLLGLAFLCSPSHSKEISKEEEHLSSSVEEIAEEMNNLNSSLDLLSITISNLMSGNSI
tara:strand:+ start:493 stop:693 length:201 start_codon:yes stop_codon:yes gene_type:complete